MADVQDYIDHVLADSPLLYWPLTGENANDVSGNAKHGTKQSGSVYEDVLPTPCRGNSAFVIPTGSGDTGGYLYYTGTLDTNAGTGLTVEFWLAVTAPSGGTTFEAGGPRMWSDTGSNKFEFTVGTTAGGVRFGTQGSTGRCDLAAGAAPSGRWIYWAFTQSAAGASRVYKNGVLVVGPNTQAVGADFPDLKVSNNAKQNTISQWQHIAVFNTELSASRIAERWALQTDDLYEFVGRDQRPATFPTVPLVPLNVGGTGGAPPPTEGQLWPRGNP
jgi:hypothetical protein